MTLQEYQDILFDILCVVDDICKKNHITYVLHGGTMLGAVRHHDFIPWDDDVDIIVWRKDYAGLCAKLREELPSHLRLVEPIDLAPNFYDYVTRVQDTRYPIHESSEEDAFYDNKQNYACVDIFQFTYSADTRWKVNWIIFQHKVLYGLGMGHRYRIKNEKYTFIQKLQTEVLSFVGSKMDMKTIISWKNKLIDKQNKNEKKYCMSVNTTVKGVGLVYESRWYDGVAYLRFRDRDLPVPKGYDGHLTLQYGNYMEPVKDREEYIQHFADEIDDIESKK